MLRAQVEPMTPERFKRLDYAEQVQFLQDAENNKATVRDLIRDRNEFKQCYFTLYAQLKDAGLTPATDYYKLHNRKEKKQHV